MECFFGVPRHDGCIVKYGQHTNMKNSCFFLWNNIILIRVKVCQKLQLLKKINEGAVRSASIICMFLNVWVYHGTYYLLTTTYQRGKVTVQTDCICQLTNYIHD